MTQTRRVFLVTASSFALAACGGNLLGPPDAGPIYTLTPTLPQMPPGPPVAWALSVMRPDAPGGLDSDRIALIQSDAIMDFYASAQYPDGLPDLVQAALIQGFERGGQVAQVARSQDALHADYNLFTTVKNFEAHYTAPGTAPSVTVTLTARLVAAHGRKIVGTYTASQTAPAAADNAGAATAALGQALGAAVAAIVTWTVGAAPVLPVLK